MPLVAAYITPHPPLAVPEVGQGEEEQIAATVAGYREVAKRIAAVAPDDIIIVSPHTAYYADWIYIAGGEGATGDMGQFDAPDASVALTYDTELRTRIESAAAGAGIPAGEVGDAVDGQGKELDHGIVVPVYYIEKEYPTTNFKAVSIGGASLPREQLLKFGRCLTDAAQQSGRKVVFLVSGDLSHKLLEDGPYGFDPAGPKFDEAFVEVVESGDPDGFVELDPAMCEAAAECGLSGFIMMAGAIKRSSEISGLGFTSELLSHEGPFGVGYGVACYERADVHTGAFDFEPVAAEVETSVPADDSYDVVEAAEAVEEEAIPVEEPEAVDEVEAVEEPVAVESLEEIVAEAQAAPTEVQEAVGEITEEVSESISGAVDDAKAAVVGVTAAGASAVAAAVEMAEEPKEKKGFFSKWRRNKQQPEPEPEPELIPIQESAETVEDVADILGGGQSPFEVEEPELPEVVEVAEPEAAIEEATEAVEADVASAMPIEVEDAAPEPEPEPKPEPQEVAEPVSDESLEAVSEADALISGSEMPFEVEEPEPVALESLTADEPDPLVVLATDVIVTYIQTGMLPQPMALPADEPDRAGCFVSIHKASTGDLRGCIGTIAPVQPTLADEVISNAVAASTRDPRFPAISESELGDLEINVDVLMAPEPATLADMDVKRYGIIVTQGWKRGLLLPDLEGIDTVEDQYRIACLKAGIDPEDKSAPIEIERFEIVRHK